MHAGDAAASQGATRPYGAELALDGIDEVVAMFFPRQVRLGRTPPLPTALAVEPAEGGRWVLCGRRHGPDSRHRDRDRVRPGGGRAAPALAPHHARRPAPRRLPATGRPPTPCSGRRPDVLNRRVPVPRLGPVAGRIRDSDIAEVRDRTRIDEVDRRVRRAAPRRRRLAQGPVPVPRREDPVVHRAAHARQLPLLRLRRGRRT